MNSKKFLSAVLAGAMALSLAVPVMAAAPDGESDGKQDYDVTAGVMEATVKVVVPSTVNLGEAVKLNPYLLAYTYGEGESAIKIEEEIFSPVQFMTNLSNTAIGVTAKVTAEARGRVVLQDSKTDYDEAMETNAGAKNVYMYLEMITVNNSQSRPTWATNYNAETHLAVTGDGNQKKNIATMEAATYTVTTTTDEEGQTTTTTTEEVAEENGMVAFHFAGKVNDKTDEVWGGEDGVHLSIVFTFTPLRTTEGVIPSDVVADVPSVG